MPHFANAYQKQSMVAPKTAPYKYFSLYSPDYSPQIVIAAIPSGNFTAHLRGAPVSSQHSLRVTICCQFSQKILDIYEGQAYDFQEQFKMQIFLFCCLFLLASSFIIPVPTGSERCMVIYSINQEDTIKLTIKFPNDHAVEQYYDYITEIRDLHGNVQSSNLVRNHIFKTEIVIPEGTIYETCVKISPNSSKSSQPSQKYQGEILIDYEANTHFITDSSNTPTASDLIKEEEIAALKAQANHVINATQEYMRLQALKKASEDEQFQERRQVQESLFEWWMVQVGVIVGIGVYQWGKMKRKLEGRSY